MAAAVIVNLYAGGGSARRRWPAVARLLEERLGPLPAHFTEGRAMPFFWLTNWPGPGSTR